MNEAGRARRRLRFFALGIAVFFGGIGFFSWWSERENLREGSHVVSRGGEPLRVTHVPRTYHAVFRTQTPNAKGDLVTTEDRIWVRRPFMSRVETWKDGRRFTLRQNVFGILASSSSGGSAPLNITAPPALSSGDLRIDAVLEEAVEGRVILRRERREVFGRQCQVYRAGGPVLAGDVTKYVPGRGDYADVCVDRNGIVIEEYWVDDEKLVRRRVATELEIDPPIDRNLFEIEVPENPNVDRGAIGRIEDEPTDDEFPLWTLEEGPSDFERLGRYAVVRSTQTIPQLGGSGGLPQLPPASTSEVFVRGPDLLVIDQDPSLGTLVDLEGRPGRDVDLGRLEDGKLILDARMSEVRGQTPEGSVVRVFGTMPTDELIALARSLKPLES